MPDRLQDYLRQVGEQIRWKRARPRLLSELETHLLDQRDDCLSQGMTEEEAQQEAVRQMGDPVLIRWMRSTGPSPSGGCWRRRWCWRG